MCKGPRLKYKISEVLCFSVSPKSRSTVRRYYDSWRQSQGLVERCDNPKCHFHDCDLVWNNEPLRLVLDHENGNSNDNRPSNLRYLCPNCDSLLPTRGGSNIGRITEQSEGGFKVRRENGQVDLNVFSKTAKLELKTHKAKVSRGENT